MFERNNFQKIFGDSSQNCASWLYRTKDDLLTVLSDGYFDQVTQIILKDEVVNITASNGLFALKFVSETNALPVIANEFPIGIPSTLLHTRYVVKEKSQKIYIPVTGAKESDMPFVNKRKGNSLIGITSAECSADTVIVECNGEIEPETIFEIVIFRF